MNTETFESLKPLLHLLTGQFGWLPSVIAWMGALRLALMPVGRWIQARLTEAVATVHASEDPEDDARLYAVLNHRFYRSVRFFADLLFSLKLPSAWSLANHLSPGTLSPDFSEGTKPAKGPTIPGSGTALLLLVTLALGTGCAQFTTTQSDLSYEEGKPVRQVTTRASAVTFLSAKSQLANFRASQTDKTQGAQVGSLSQETSGTNAVRALEALAEILKTVK